MSNVFYAVALIAVSLVAGCKSSGNDTPEENGFTQISDNGTEIRSYKGSRFLQREPIILVRKQGAYIGKTVLLQEDISLRDQEVPGALKREWRITAADKSVVFTQNDVSFLKWVPEAAGVFKAELTLTSAQEVQKVSELIYVLKSQPTTFDSQTVFQAAKTNIAGTWYGKVTMPWTGPFLVQMNFNSDGTLDARSLSTPVSGNGAYRSLNSPLYYINAEPGTSHVKYELTDVLSNGEIIGEMEGLAMKQLRFSEDGNRVYFELWNGSSGPLEYSLAKYQPRETHVSLQGVTDAIVGDWVGSASSPWDQPHEVSFSFHSDGTYSASSLVSGYTALGYGSDDESPYKAYSINNVLDNGQSEGEITVWLEGSNTSVGAIRKLEISKDGKFLKFEFWHRNEFGPIKYVLMKN